MAAVLYSWSVATIRLVGGDGDVHASGVGRDLDRAIVAMSRALAGAPSGAVGIIAAVPMNVYVPSSRPGEVVAMASYDADRNRVDLVEM
jgi:hypothetical protein